MGWTHPVSYRQDGVVKNAQIQFRFYKIIFILVYLDFLFYLRKVLLFQKE